MMNSFIFKIEFWREMLNSFVAAIKPDFSRKKFICIGHKNRYYATIKPKQHIKLRDLPRFIP